MFSESVEGERDLMVEVVLTVGDGLGYRTVRGEIPGHSPEDGGIWKLVIGDGLTGVSVAEVYEVLELLVGVADGGVVKEAETKRVPGGELGIELFHFVPPGERKGSEGRLSPAVYTEPQTLDGPHPQEPRFRKCFDGGFKESYLTKLARARANVK